MFNRFIYSDIQNYSMSWTNSGILASYPTGGPVNTYRSAKVIVRHGPNCNHEKKCNCRKSLLLYDPNGIPTKQGLRTQVKVSAKTTSWDAAEKACREWLESFDPDKIEIKRLKAEKETKTATIEKAVETFLCRKPGKLAEQTLANNRTLFGSVKVGPILEC